MSAVARSRLSARDVLAAGAVGLRTRPLRTVLSALGVGIGVAAMVAVLGISSSSRADLLARLDALGTNLLRVEAGETFRGEDASLPEGSASSVRRIGPVQAVAATAGVSASVRRTDRVPASETGGISVRAADPELLSAIGGRVASGSFLNAATEQHPAVVLGAVAARRLAITAADGSVAVWLGERWFTVVGVLEPVDLAPEIDRSALVGFGAAKTHLGHDGAPGTVYLRTSPEQVDAVRRVLPATVRPEAPDEVVVSRPSDALAARAAAKGALTSLFLGLGMVALVVGGVGIANVMVMSVLERRSEIGLRRALGATRRHVRLQFLAESVLLSATGGLAGVLLGGVVTASYAAHQGWTLALPVLVLLGGVAASLVLGAVAGVYPAVRAARLAPTDALRSA